MNETESVMLEDCNPNEKETESSNPADEESFDELSFLREEVQNLKDQLSEREKLDQANARIGFEISEFYSYFPESRVEEIPDEVWEKVKKGSSLSAEYSLFRRKAEIEKQKISDINEKNRKMSTGSLGFGDGEKYYSPTEVKKMTPAEVKKHYDDIIESMRHWN